METTYLLVDLENQQPSAQDFARVRGDSYRLLIFHGPQQKRFDADVVQAWQPLGERVQFIQCPKSGRNALDMHIAFHIGVILEQHTRSGGEQNEAPRIVVISNDTDFDPLLQYLRTLNYAANRSATLRAALGTVAGADGKGTKAAPTPSPPAAKKTAAKGATAAKKTATKKTRAAKTKAEAHAAASKQLALLALAPAGPDPVDKLIRHLEAHAKDRPSKRKALEKYIASVLRGKVQADVVPELVAELEARGLIALSGTKVEYPRWLADEA